MRLSLVFAVFIFFYPGYARESNSVLDYVKHLRKNNPTPVVIWHGMSDNCCNDLMTRYVNLIQKEVDGVYVKSIMIGDSMVADTAHGYFGDSNDEVAQACQMIANDANLTNGYNAVGFSQGALFLRVLAQRCPNPPMKNLVSLGGPQQGIFGLPSCPGETSVCDTVRRMLGAGAYVFFVQDYLIPAQYWHDPSDVATYREKSIFLGNANAEKPINQTYVDNLKKLNNLVLVKFINDTMIVPKESEWFGYYADGDTTKIIPMEESKLYTEDRIGIKWMKENGKLQLVALDGDHLALSDEVFTKEVIDKYLK